jgi:hypothetical protein
VHLWAQAYDAELAEVFKLQSTIAERVADALEVTLKVPERAALEEGGTSDPDAYDYYLRGNDYLSRGNTRPALSAAVELYQKAVARDPRVRARIRAALERPQPDVLVRPRWRGLAYGTFEARCRLHSRSRA